MPDKENREAAQPPRRPYEPPAVEQDETFETLALACAKAAGPACVAGGSMS